MLGFWLVRVRRFYRVNHSLTGPHGTVRYLLQVPPGHDLTRPSPLVVVLHGFLQSPGHQREMSRWDDLAAREGFLTVYPLGQGIPPHWDAADAGETPATRRQVDAIAALIEHLASRYPIDRDRIYASGMSNGGGLVASLVLTLPDTFAAASSVSGLYTLAPAGPAVPRPVPLIAFHGALDRIIPITGGVRRLGRQVPDARDWLDGYARHCGCTASTTEDLGARVRRTTWSGGREDCEVVWYAFADGGHTWPGGVPLPEVITGPTLARPDATRLSWEFFQRHPRSTGAAVRGPSAPRA